MSKIISAVNTNLAFATLFTAVNSMIQILGNEIVTANGAAGGGATTTGNGFVVGIFGANTIVATNIQGGNVTTANTLNLTSNLALTSGLTINVGTNTLNATSWSGTSNNTLFVGSVTAANVVSNAQLQSNLSNYLLNSDLTSEVELLISTSTANNTLFVGSVTAANVVSNTQLSANLANYLTIAGLGANVQPLISPQIQTLTCNVGGITSWTVNSTATITYLRLTGNTTIAYPTGVANGTYLLIVQQSATAAPFYLNYGISNSTAGFWFPQSMAPVLSTVNNAIDMLSFATGFPSNTTVLLGSWAPNFGAV